MQAHSEQDSQPTFVDEWAVKGKNAADKCAAEARNTFPPQLQPATATFLAEITQLPTFGKAWRRVLVAIGQRALVTTMPTNDAPPPAGILDIINHADAGIQYISTLSVEDFQKKFRIEELPFVLQWLQTLVSPSGSAVWVTFHQLLVDYEQPAQDRSG